jgi:hypothetical protein
MNEPKESTTSSTNIRGTFCVVIQKQLAVSQCPLAGNSCIWKHRKTSRCTYNEAFANSEFTPNEFAARVGLPSAEVSVLDIIRNSLADKIRREIVG